MHEIMLVYRLDEDLSFILQLLCLTDQPSLNYYHIKKYVRSCLYRWLSAILKRAMYSLKVSKVMEAKSMDKIKEDYEQVGFVRGTTLVVYFQSCCYSINLH